MFPDFSHLKSILPLMPWKIGRQRTSLKKDNFARWIETEAFRQAFTICYTYRKDKAVETDFRMLRAAPSMLRLLLRFHEYRPEGYTIEEKDWALMEEILDSIDRES